MTDQERDIITRFIQRVGGAPQGSAPQGGGGFAGSVPATAPALPPIDREADALISDLFGRYPEARYRLTQMAFVQEAALVEAQNRIKRMEWEVEQARQAAQQPPQGAAGAAPGSSPWGAQGQPQPQPQQQQSRGFFGGLFGGQQQQAPRSAPPPQYAPPPPQYPQGYQPGMFQRSGSGFLGSALTTAAGVAGGLVAGNALMNLFSGHQGFGGGYGGFAGPGMGSETVVNNYYEGGDPQGGPQGDPWAGAGQDPGNAGFLGQPDQGGVDPGGTDQGGADPFSQAGNDPGGFADSGQDPGSDAGWDSADNSGGMDDDNLA